MEVYRSDYVVQKKSSGHCNYLPRSFQLVRHHRVDDVDKYGYTHGNSTQYNEDKCISNHITLLPRNRVRTRKNRVEYNES